MNFKPNNPYLTKANKIFKAPIISRTDVGIYDSNQNFKSDVLYDR